VTVALVSHNSLYIAPHGHGVLVLFREGGDDTKAVALDGVVGDSGHVLD
jgi:hypothetical protein